MTETIVRRGPGECSNIETGARYFATLAFPARHEREARDDATKAWVAQYLQEANRTDGTDAAFEDPKFNEFVALDPAWCKSRLRTVRRRLRDRADLGRALRPWTCELRGEEHPPVPGIDQFTQRQIGLVTVLCRSLESLTLDQGDRRERAKLRFRRMKTLQKFAAVHANVHNHFNQERHLIDLQIYKLCHSAALAEWQAVMS